MNQAGIAVTRLGIVIPGEQPRLRMLAAVQEQLRLRPWGFG